MKKKLTVSIFVLFLFIQLIPVDRTPPPPGLEISAPADVLNILRTSCYDCHSHNTTWPAYAEVAPVSWWVNDHVQEGREHLNFSDWGSYSSKDQAELMEEISEEVDEGEMPLPSYLWIHGEARLSTADKEILRAWTHSNSHGSNNRS
jgi:hypothetical protein